MKIDFHNVIGKPSTLKIHKNIAEVLQLNEGEVTQIEPHAYYKVVYIQCNTEQTVQRILNNTNGQVTFEFNKRQYNLPISKVYEDITKISIPSLPQFFPDELVSECISRFGTVVLIN